MNGPDFLDTNVLVYAHDIRAGQKHTIARDLVRHLWDTRQGALSTQVLQEFYVTATRKMAIPLDRPAARQIVREYGRWHLEQISVSHIIAASEIEARYQLSFWDALIISAAQQIGASRVLSEDLQSGQTLAGVRIENPLAP